MKQLNTNTPRLRARLPGTPTPARAAPRPGQGRQSGSRLKDLAEAAGRLIIVNGGVVFIHLAAAKFIFLTI